MQMGEEDDEIPLMCLHQVSDMWVWYNDGVAPRTAREDEEEEEGESSRVVLKGKAQTMKAKGVEPRRAVLWLQMETEAMVAVCLRPYRGPTALVVWGPTRKVLAPAMYVGHAVHVGGCAGHLEAGREPGSWCLPLAPRGGGAGLAPRHTRSGPRCGVSCPWRVPPASVSGFVRCGGFACVDTEGEGTTSAGGVGGVGVAVWQGGMLLV